jgi:hypothetical protein
VNGLTLDERFQLCRWVALTRVFSYEQRCTMAFLAVVWLLRGKCKEIPKEQGSQSVSSTLRQQGPSSCQLAVVVGNALLVLHVVGVEQQH